MLSGRVRLYTATRRPIAVTYMNEQTMKTPHKRYDRYKQTAASVRLQTRRVTDR